MFFYRNFKYWILVLIVFFSPVSGFTLEEIKWLTFHWEPTMKLDSVSGDISGGVSGRQLILLMENIQGYNHTTIQMNWSRFWDVIKKKNDNICNCMVLKTKEREKLAEFSLPFSVALPVSVIMRKDSAEKIGNPESVSLVSLMHDSRVKGLLLYGRSYTESLDRLLAVHENKSNLTRQVTNGTSSILMLLYNRMDYVLEYPGKLDTSLSPLTKAEVDQLVVIPIREIEPCSLVYVACTKNKWGKRAIRAINQNISKIHANPAFRASYSEAYSGVRLEAIENLYDSYFGKTKK